MPADFSIQIVYNANDIQISLTPNFNSNTLQQAVLSSNTSAAILTTSLLGIPFDELIPLMAAKDNFYINVILGGGANFFNLNRSIDLNKSHWTARSSPFGGELDSLLGGGYEINLGSWRLGANTSLQYTYLGVTSFNESQAKNFNTKLRNQNSGSLVFTLGGNISYLWAITPYYQILPTIGLSWQHEFLNYSQNFSGRFANGAGAPFEFSSLSGARNNAFGTAGITAQLGPRLGAYTYYTPQFGGQQIVSHGVLVGFNFNF